MTDLIARLAIQIPAFLLAIVIHEASHAFMATKFGDDTPKYNGRLTLDPLVHLDLLGTVIFPLIGALIGGMMFGWAKPVPIDPRNFKNIRSGIFWVSFAGPLSNIILAVVCSFLLAFMFTNVSNDFYFFSPFTQILRASISINIILAVFNLIPFPPLDGSKMVSSFLNYKQLMQYESLARYSFIFFIFLMMTGALYYVITPALYLGEMTIGLFYQLLA